MAVATNGLHSDGTVLEYKIGVGEWTPLGEVMDIDAGSLKRTTVNKKRISPANSIKKKMKGLKEVGPWKVQLGFKTAQEADLYAMWSDGTEAQWRVTFPDTSALLIPVGWIAEYTPPKAKEDDELQSEVTIENDGSQPTWTEET